MSLLPVKQYTSASEIIEAAKALRRKRDGYRPPVEVRQLPKPDVWADLARDLAEQERLRQERYWAERKLFEDKLDEERLAIVAEYNKELLVKLKAGQAGVAYQFIFDAVCARYEVTPFIMRSPRRTVSIIKPRHEYCWLCTRLTLLSLSQIGKTIGNRDHTSVLHAYQKIDRQIDVNPAYGDELSTWAEQIKRDYIESLGG